MCGEDCLEKWQPCNGTCDYTEQHKCGDVCIDNRKNCKCWDQVFRIGDGSKHCCVPPTTLAQCHLDENENGVCPGGTTLSLTELGNGQCYNQYSQELNTSALSLRSMYPCDNGDCMYAQTMCRGYPSCGDKSDLRACNPEMTCVYLRSGSTMSTITSDLMDGHSLCIYSNARNDGQYDAISRRGQPGHCVHKHQPRL